MLATPYEAIAYLLKARLLGEKDVLDKSFAIFDVTRRNKNYRIIAPGLSFLVKQGTSSLAQEAIGSLTATLANEARACRFLLSLNGGTLRNFVPECRLYDSENDVLILRTLGNGQSLAAYCSTTQRIPVLPSRLLGKALGAVHHATRVANLSIKDSTLHHHRPWLFSILPYPPRWFLEQASGGMIEIVHMVQRFPDFCALLEQLSSQWSINALIHGDIKWDNCVVAPGSSGGPTNRLIITDWELAGFGDTRWDVGCALAEFLVFWLSSGPADPKISPASFAEHTRYRLERFHPVVRALWAEYCGEANFDILRNSELLESSVKYAAGALIQRTFEELQSQPRAGAGSVLALQLSLNMLQHPRRAAEVLLGLC
jgi:hypothetical protein